MNFVGWFEIPVVNMGRAIKFYQAVFGVKFQRNKMGPADMAFFPWTKNGTGSAGTLVKHSNSRPSTDGVLIYFMSKKGDLNNELGRVRKAGGKVIQPKMSIGQHGYIGIFVDTEGNKIAVHSMK